MKNTIGEFPLKNKNTNYSQGKTNNLYFFALECTNDRIIRDDCFLLYHYNAIANSMSLEITVFKVFTSINTDIVADSRTLVDNRVVDITALSHPHERLT